MTRPDPVSARPAEIGDLSVTRVLSDLARREAIDGRGGRLLIEHDQLAESAGDLHRAALDSADTILVVGTIDGVVVGHGFAYLSIRGEISVCMIDELFVHPEARGVGVAAAMLEALRQWATDNDCTALESHVLPGDRESKNFFERVGMVARKMRVSTQL